jgi:hypothetical protein
MVEVSVARLAIKAAPGRVGETRMRSEDALRLAVPEDDRLLVLRRLDLGALPARAPPAFWEARVADRLREQRASAVHATQPGAADAAAVWFRSGKEARALLLGLLASGRAPTAWFWRLAIPGWQGASPSDWVASEIAHALLHPKAMPPLARALIAAVEAGEVARVLVWLAQAAAPPAMSQSFATPMPSRSPTARAELAQADLVLAPRARQLFARLEPGAARAIRAQLVNAGGTQAGRAWLTRFALVAAAPELAAAPEAISRLAHALQEAILADAVDPAPQVEKGRAPADRVPPRLDTSADPVRRTARASDRPKAVEHPVEVKEAPPARDESESSAHAEPEPLSDYSRERATKAAGIFLLVRPLWRMNIEPWLADRPDLAAAGFGRTLLLHIARRMRVDVEDPLFALLGESEPTDPALLAAWRIGLDRWLRRNVRRTLADIVNRPGHLIGRDEGIDIRMSPESADIRLRRHALDLDPGWVGWLGLVIRYRYRDGPLA